MATKRSTTTKRTTSSRAGSSSASAWGQTSKKGTTKSLAQNRTNTTKTLRKPTKTDWRPSSARSQKTRELPYNETSWSSEPSRKPARMSRSSSGCQTEDGYCKSCGQKYPRENTQQSKWESTTYGLKDARWGQEENDNEGIYPNLGVQELYFEEDFEEAPISRSKTGKKENR